MVLPHLGPRLPPLIDKLQALLLHLLRLECKGIDVGGWGAGGRAAGERGSSGEGEKVEKALRPHTAPAEAHEKEGWGGGEEESEAGRRGGAVTLARDGQVAGWAGGGEARWGGGGAGGRGGGSKCHALLRLLVALVPCHLFDFLREVCAEDELFYYFIFACSWPYTRPRLDFNIPRYSYIYIC
jgi:hypothetical protein